MIQTLIRFLKIRGLRDCDFDGCTRKYGLRIRRPSEMLLLVKTPEDIMVQTMEAVFDGEVLRPADPVALEPNTRVRITIETVERASAEKASFLDTARRLNLNGPPDWATNIDAYLYDGEARHEG
jgi:predicted DNA-binding antitoxin AbrB/MazE fold protein